MDNQAWEWISLLEPTASISLYYHLGRLVLTPRMWSLQLGCGQQLWVGALLFSLLFFPLYMETWDCLCLLPYKKSSSIMWIYSFKWKYIPNSTIHFSASSLLWHYASERPAVPSCLSSSPFCPQLETGKTCCSVPVHESHWKLWWVWIKIAHENVIKTSSSLAECQQQGKSPKGIQCYIPKDPASYLMSFWRRHCPKSKSATHLYSPQ